MVERDQQLVSKSLEIGNVNEGRWPVTLVIVDNQLVSLKCGTQNGQNML